MKGITSKAFMLTLFLLYIPVSATGQANNTAAYGYVQHSSQPITKTIDLKTTCRPAHEQSQAPLITVWVHGSNLLKQITAPLFRMAHIDMFPPQGFYLVTHLPENHDIRAIATALANSAPDDFRLEQFYVFGWPGDLDFQQRETAAKTLYGELQKLLAACQQKYGITPGIRLISHSHGGNVVLNMAKIKNPADGISIAETVLLACPVQEETQNCIFDPFFEKIYALYSTRDNIQVLDPQGLYLTERNQQPHMQFSKRAFPSALHLHQAQITGHWFGFKHEDFIKPSFIKHLPTVLHTLDTWQQENPATPGQDRILTLLHC